MGLMATDSGTTFELAPPGTHLAICCQVIDLGTQFSAFYQKSSHKVLIGWELPEEKNEAGEPFLTWNRYTVSLHEKSTLCNHLESWRGRQFTEEERKGFALKGLLGKPCLLSIVHETNEGKTYSRIKSVMAPPKGTKAPALHHEQVLFDIDQWDPKVFATFSDNLKKTIEGCEERKGKATTNGKATGNGSSPVSAAEVAEAGADDIPF